MSKHKIGDEKLHSYRSDKAKPARIRDDSTSAGARKRTNADNQFR